MENIVAEVNDAFETESLNEALCAKFLALTPENKILFIEYLQHEVETVH